MARHEKYYNRPSHYSSWHRTLDDRFAMVDIDALHFCDKCKTPLAVMELAQDVGQHKKSFLQTLHVARGMQIPGYVVLYKIDENTDIDSEIMLGFRIMKIYPEISDFYEVSVDQYKAWMASLHDNCLRCTNGQDS